MFETQCIIEIPTGYDKTEALLAYLKNENGNRYEFTVKEDDHVRVPRVAQCKPHKEFSSFYENMPIPGIPLPDFSNQISEFMANNPSEKFPAPWQC